MGTPLTFRILHTECSPNWGGQKMRILEQIQWLNNNKHLAWLAAGSKSRSIRHASRRMGLPCVEVEFRGSANPKAISRLYRFVKKNAVDLIDAHSSRDSCLVAWLRLFGYRVVRSLHVTKEIKFDFFHAPFWRYGSDRIIVTAELIKNRLTKLGLAAERIDVVGEGIDLKRFDWRISGAGVRKELGLAANCRVVANIGMIRPDKGQLHFVNSAALVAKRMPEVVFLIVGEGTRPKFEHQVRERIRVLGMENRVLMIGYRDDVQEIMAASDCIVLASIAVEAQSRIVPQAFAMKNR